MDCIFHIFCIFCICPRPISLILESCAALLEHDCGGRRARRKRAHGGVVDHQYITDHCGRHRLCFAIPLRTEKRGRLKYASKITI